MWAQAINIFFGAWLMIAPSVFSMNDSTANNNYIVGPLVITFSVISMWKINKNVIKANIPLGLWLLVSLFIFEYATSIAFFSNGACGAFIITLSAKRSNVERNFGGGWRSLFQNNPLHMREAEKRSTGSEA